MCCRGHETPADPGDHHLRIHPGDGKSPGDSALQASPGETLAGQGDGQLQRPGDLAQSVQAGQQGNNCPSPPSQSLRNLEFTQSPPSTYGLSSKSLCESTSWTNLIA